MNLCIFRDAQIRSGAGQPPRIGALFAGSRLLTEKRPH